MATLTAIVTHEGLTLTPEGKEHFQQAVDDFELRLGDEVTVSITSRRLRPLPADVERLIKEARGMLGGPHGLAEELIRERREEDKRAKW